MKALALFSGGLDSLLAIRLMQESGIEVEGLYFHQPFLPVEVQEKKINRIKKLIDQTSARLHVVHLGRDYLNMLENPCFGYGRSFNPCLDCHLFFLKKAGEMLVSMNASFIITGEVLGQRPKSQFTGAFEIIDRAAGLQGLVVRPLSAKLLQKTIPEIKGWISLDHCPAIKGRNRRTQMELAEKYGLEYASPAGGCLLTEEVYGAKIKDYLRHVGHLNLDAMLLCSLGRHFRFSHGFKAIVGRNEAENKELIRYFSIQPEQACLLQCVNVQGPAALGQGILSDTAIEWLAKIVARYSDASDGQLTDILVKKAGGDLSSFGISADKKIALEQYRI
ncbi:MAG: hypothetical protein ACM3WV_05405 [Bacillota bacterium]